MVKTSSSRPLPVPFKIAVDQREKAPYAFADLFADAKRSYRPLVVAYEYAHLKTGDYSIFGHESRVAIERKSLEDIYGTLSTEERRERFRAEVIRLAEMPSRAIIVEASMIQTLKFPPPQSRLNPKTVYRTMVRWTARYGVPWIFADDRRLAEVTTFRLLEAFWEDLKNAGT